MIMIIDNAHDTLKVLTDEKGPELYVLSEEEFNKLSKIISKHKKCQEEIRKEFDQGFDWYEVTI